MMLRFSRKKFESNAPVSVRKTLKPHLDALDGLTVDFPAGESYGTIASYKAEGQDWMLYPVYPEWCEEAES